MILYNDKHKLFECKLGLDSDDGNVSFSNTEVRLVLESKRRAWKLMFLGTLDETGYCKVNIDKLNILDEGEAGTIRLEVIADDTVFKMWQDEFEIKKNKKVTVEIITKDEPKLTEQKRLVMTHISEKPRERQEQTGIEEAIDRMRNSKITLDNFKENGQVFERIITETANKHNIKSDAEKKAFMKSIIDFLAR